MNVISFARDAGIFLSDQNSQRYLGGCMYFRSARYPGRRANVIAYLGWPGIRGRCYLS